MDGSRHRGFAERDAITTFDRHFMKIQNYPNGSNNMHNMIGHGASDTAAGAGSGDGENNLESNTNTNNNNNNNTSNNNTNKKRIMKNAILRRLHTARQRKRPQHDFSSLAPWSHLLWSYDQTPAGN